MLLFLFTLLISGPVTNTVNYSAGYKLICIRFFFSEKLIYFNNEIA